MMELVYSPANSGSTSYLLKLAVDNAVKGHKVLVASPELKERDMLKKMYAYSEYHDYIEQNIDVCSLPFSSDSFNILKNFLRGKYKYHTIIVDCASMMLSFTSNTTSSEAIQEIKSRCEVIICGMQMHRDRVIAKPIISAPHYLFPWVNRITQLQLLRDRSLDGNSTVLLNVSKTDDIHSNMKLNYEESYTFEQVKNFAVRLVRI